MLKKLYINGSVLATETYTAYAMINGLCAKAAVHLYNPLPSSLQLMTPTGYALYKSWLLFILYIIMNIKILLQQIIVNDRLWIGKPKSAHKIVHFYQHPLLGPIAQKITAWLVGEFVEASNISLWNSCTSSLYSTTVSTNLSQLNVYLKLQHFHFAFFLK